MMVNLKKLQKNIKVSQEVPEVSTEKRL